MRNRAATALALFLLGSTAEVAAGQDQGTPPAGPLEAPVVEAGWIGGPLSVAERNPLYQLFHVPVAELADPLAPGELQASLGVSVLNVFERARTSTHVQDFDLERLLTTITFRAGVRPGLEVGARMGTRTDGGGVLDGFIQGFHDAFDLPNAKREEVPNGRYLLSLTEVSGEPRLEVPLRRFALEDLRIFAKQRLLGEVASPGSLSVRGTAKLPTGSAEAGTGRTDLAVELLGRIGLGSRVQFHGMLGGVTLRAPAKLDAIVEPSAVVMMGAAEVRVGAATSLVVQVIGSTPYVGATGTENLDEPAMNLVLGVQGAFGQDWGWQFAFSEDVPPASPSVDFVVDLAVSRRW